MRMLWVVERRAPERSTQVRLGIRSAEAMLALEHRATVAVVSTTAILE